MTLAEEFEDFDLESALQSYSTTPEEERKRCPECLSPNITRKTHRHKDVEHRQDGRYRCEIRECGAHFDEPRTGLTNEEAGRNGHEGGKEPDLERDSRGRFLPKNGGTRDA